MKMKHSIAILLISSLFVTSHSFAGDPDGNPYEFDWKSANDMSGAFMMCGLTGFVIDQCPKVLLKCMTDRDLLRIRPFSVKSKCLRLFQFIMNATDVDKAFTEAKSRASKDEPEVNNVNTRDFRPHTDPVIASHEQDSNPEEPVGRESYAGTIYDRAERATENLINRDYFDFYYYGDGRGNGGWGAPDYQRGLFESDYYGDLSPQEAYDQEYSRVYQTSFDDNYDRIYEQTLSEFERDFQAGTIPPDSPLLAEIDRLATEEAESIAITDATAAATTAFNTQSSLVDDEYNDWRDSQPWANFNHFRNQFETSYNMNRLGIFYTAYINAANNCDHACAERKAFEALENVAYGP